MSISDIRPAAEIRCGRKRSNKTVRLYLVLALAAIIINNVYALFGHGVHSLSMTWMFLYPLLGGALFYSLIYLLFPGTRESAGKHSAYRLFFNLYNSGIAVLTISAFLKGILEIAGTGSPYVPYSFGAGAALTATGLAVLVYNLKKH